MKKIYIKTISVFLAVITFCSFVFGCSSGDRSQNENGDFTQSDLMIGISPQVIAERLPDTAYYNILRKMISAVSVKSLSGKVNSAVSPISSVFSVSLIANSMSDKNQTEILHMLGDLKITALNEYNATFAHIIKQESNVSVYTSFRLNSDKEGYTPSKTFLQVNADYYGADAYRSSFAEGNVNILLTEWVKVKLGIQEFTADAKCTADSYSLVADTVSITGSFEKGFCAKESGIFKTSGSEKEVDFLISTESLRASTEKSTGIAKKLDNGYTFIALMPKTGVTLDQLVQSLDADTLKNCFIKKEVTSSFGIKIPEFSFTYLSDTVPALKAMNVKSVFEKSVAKETESTDFPLEKILNITSVTFNENGISTSSSAPEEPAEKTDIPQEIFQGETFDKPFVFIIYDSNGIPLTLGTVVDP